MIKPSIGRVLLFTPQVNERDLASDQPLASMVTYVHSDTLVNLVVFDRDGRSHPKTSVMLLQDDMPAPEQGNYAQWMQFQKGQAAKTEELEQKMAAQPDRAP